MPFDPSAPFTVVDEAPSGFDASKPFQVIPSAEDEQRLARQEQARQVGKENQSIGESRESLARSGLPQAILGGMKPTAGFGEIAGRVASAPFSLIDAALPHLSPGERLALAKTSPRMEKIEAAAELAGKVAPLLLPLGVAGGGGRLGKAIGLGFGAQGAMQLPETAREAGTVFGTPGSTPGEKLLAGGQLAMGTALPALMLGGAAMPERAPVAPVVARVQGPPAPGELLRMPPGTRPTPTEPVGPAVTPAQLLQLNRAKPVVPATPSEPRTSVIEEIRAAGADTLNKIKALYPKDQRSNEQWRVLRDLAFPKTKEAPTVEAPKGQNATEKISESGSVSTQRPGNDEGGTPAGRGAGGGLPGTASSETPGQVQEEKVTPVTEAQTRAVEAQIVELTGDPYHADAARAMADREGWSEDSYLQALNDTLAELKARKGQPSAAPAPAQIEAPAPAPAKAKEFTEEERQQAAAEHDRLQSGWTAQEIDQHNHLREERKKAESGWMSGDPAATAEFERLHKAMTALENRHGGTQPPTKTVETPPPTKTVETPAETTPAEASTKIKQAVAGVPVEPVAGMPSQKQAKSQLLTKLEAAIAIAPGESEIPAGKQAEKITIDIPGDGVFTINNTKEALQTVLDRTKKLSVSSAESPSIKRRPISKEDKAWVEEQLKNPGSKPAGTTETPTGPTGILGFGGGTRTPSVPAPSEDPAPPAATEEEISTAQTLATPGLQILRNIKQGILSLLLPSAKSPAHLQAAEILGSKLGSMHRRGEAAASTLKPFGKLFDKLGLDRKGVAPADNKGLQFMSNMSQGRPMTGWMKSAADAIDKLFEGRLEELEKAGAPLKTIRDNYFPGLWTRESRLAFNAAMERAQAEGIIPKDLDLNNATPAQKAAVKKMVDEFLEQGKGSDQDALQYLTRRPLKGREGFRKEKAFDDIMDAAEFGLRPVSTNPVDLVKLKLAEIDKSIMASQLFQELKGRGQLKIINPYEETPEGWQRLNDKYGTLYGPPTVSVSEHIDQGVYEGLVDFAKSLGIKHERSMKFPSGPGQRALGLSYQGQNLVRSKFATETSVLAHEIGHQLDYRYDFWKRFVEDAVGLGKKGVQTKGASQKAREQVRRELRAIADLTGARGGDPRKRVEQIAQMVEAYVHAPEKMKEVAPKVFQTFDDFIKSKPELEGLSKIKPGLALEKLSAEKYVGLPIVGYRIVPDSVGDVVNNYLSSSLYNNRYFGPLYKGWMETANALNQTQLGMGSAFHGGFTTIEAQVSSGANVLKDIYSVLRGGRTAADLGASIAKNFGATVRTPIVGDRVLNAWRNPEGAMNPRIRQVTEAAELAGGGFKMERGLFTEQSTKMLRNWYSGEKVKAALRSPVALTELLAKPIMEYLVPRQKAGVFAELAWRIIDQNPGKSLEELRPQFRQAWNRTDARLGQVRYDRLFINNIAKNVAQGLIRAPGWSGGTIAEIGGGFADAGRFLSDWVKTGKLPENLPDRTAYVLSLVMGISAANAVLTYAFTGQTPRGMDYLAFRTGRKDQQGNDERFLLPSYMKDILAYARHPGQTLLNKTHPLVSIVSDVAKNKNYYGVEIRDPQAGLATQAGQAGAYVIKSFEPFWTRGARQERERGAGAARQVAPFFGVMPAPRSVTQSPAESLAHDLMLEQVPSGPRTQAQADKGQQKAATNSIPYLIRTVNKLSAASAVRVFEKGDQAEKSKLLRLVWGKIENSRSLTPAEKKSLQDRVQSAR